MIMNILVTGAKGFVGKNLCVSLKNIRDGKDKTRPSLVIGEIYEYDIDTDEESYTMVAEGFDDSYSMAARNYDKLPKEILDKMRKQHRSKKDDEN